ncbi:MAG TPA: peptidylprolyl isomerase [Pseudomonadales bacterium]
MSGPEDVRAGGDGPGLISGPGSRAIRTGDRVRLHFALFLETGEEVDTTRRGNPAMLTVGDGNLLPGFESVLIGLRAGDDVQALIEPEAAFGAHRQENLQLFRKDRFGADMVLEQGLMVSFQGPGGELPGVVRRVMEDHVEVDFNHPLAGRRILFDVSIIEVRAP